MATGWKGIGLGALGLLALETLVQEEASTRVGALFAAPGRVARRFLDPTVPAIPDRRSSSSSSASSEPAVATTTAPAPTVPLIPGWPTGGTLA